MSRQKENRIQTCYRISPETPKLLGELAIALGFIYGTKKETGEPIPAVGELLDAIAHGKLSDLSAISKVD